LVANGDNSLNHLLGKGAQQAERICVDIIGTDDTKYIAKELRDAFQYNAELKEVLLLKGSRLITITRRNIESMSFNKDFRKIWERSK
jgi:hypothetical protein